MSDELHDLIAGAAAGGGVLLRDQALAITSPRVLERAVGRGDLVRLLPRTYVLAAFADDPAVRGRAAVAYAGCTAALSHLSALRTWQLPVPAAANEHVTVWDGRHPRCTSVATFHRAKVTPQTVTRDGLRVVHLDFAVVTSWPLLRHPDRHAPVIAAVADRRTTPARLRATALAFSNLADRAGLLSLIDLLDSGCRSPLELWGYERVFTHPSLPPSVGQFQVRLGGRSVYLDRAFERELVDVELDGAATHGSRRDRERDLRRDAELMSLGWLVLRYTAPRLHGAPDAVRSEIREILLKRRTQFGIAE